MRIVRAAEAEHLPTFYTKIDGAMIPRLLSQGFECYIHNGQAFIDGKSWAVDRMQLGGTQCYRKEGRKMVPHGPPGEHRGN